MRRGDENWMAKGSMQGKNEILPTFCGTRDIFFWNIHLEKPKFLCLEKKALHFVATAKCRYFDCGDPRLMDQRNSGSTPAFCCSPHTFTRPRWFLRYVKVTRLCVYTHPFFLRFFLSKCLKVSSSPCFSVPCKLLCVYFSMVAMGFSV